MLALNSRLAYRYHNLIIHRYTILLIQYSHFTAFRTRVLAILKTQVQSKSSCQQSTLMETWASKSDRTVNLRSLQVMTHELDCFC